MPPTHLTHCLSRPTFPGINQFLGNDKFISGTVKSEGLTLNANREELRGFVAEMKRKGSAADIEGLEPMATS